MPLLPTARGKKTMLLMYANHLVNRGGVRSGVTVTADSEDAGGSMGASYLLTEWKADAWRSGSVATRSGAGTPEILITFALPTARTMDFVAIEWSNLRLPWRADLYAGDPDAAGVLVDTTDWTEPIVVAEAGDFPASQVPSALGPDAERVAELAALFRLKTFQTLATPATGVDHVRFRIDCTSGANGAVDYVQASLFYAGLRFHPFVNMDLGNAISPVSRSRINRTAGGAKAGISRPLHRRADLALSYLTEEEALELATDWMEREGEFARVFFWREPANDKRHLFYGFHGAYTGTGETFEGVTIDNLHAIAEGSTAPVTKAIKGIRIEETT